MTGDMLSRPLANIEDSGNSGRAGPFSDRAGTNPPGRHDPRLVAAFCAVCDLMNARLLAYYESRCRALQRVGIDTASGESLTRDPR